jgi:acyl-CoA synthetase (AMP-forming)/AMP-acid ligase II
MLNPISKAFKKSKKENRPALLTYTVAGDSSKKQSLEILKSISKYADILEFGVPHNTPVADGGQIQTSSYRAIKNGIQMNNVFKIVKNYKKSKNSKPIILMGYYNMIYQFGENKYLKECKKSGENVMLGYWNNDEETKKVLKDGWLHTGDIGVFDEGYLKITDRKKDILITPGGDNISPVKIENELSNSSFIDQSIVYGDNKPYLVALLVLSDEHLNATQEELEKEIDKVNLNLSKIENIKKFFVIKEKFSIENGMLTPTLKLKRYKIVQKYKNEFEKFY